MKLDLTKTPTEKGIFNNRDFLAVMDFLNNDPLTDRYLDFGGKVDDDGNVRIFAYDISTYQAVAYVERA